MKNNSRALKQRMGMRIFIVAGMVSLLLIVMLIRLAWLQWLPHGSSTVFGDHFKNESVHQRERGIVLDTGRADFIDRYGKAITGESVTAVAGFPLRSGTWGDPEQLAELASILQTDRKTLLAWLSELREPAFWRLPGDKQPYRLSDGQLDVLSKLHLNGVRVLPYRARYIEAFAAKHAIGYISQHPERVDVIYGQQLIEGKMKRSEVIGGAGLEKSLDALLRGIGPTSVLHFTDGVDNALHGLNVRMIRQENPYYPLKVQTTLDLDLQNKLESYLAEQGLKEGAVVVLDAETADIAAMISMPMLNPRHLHLSGSEMINRAIHAVAPGSVFKLVTEAAALEAGAAKPGDTFHCDGEYERYGLSCWKPGGHGTLTLSEALAQSCNVVFATIGERLTAQQLQHTAERLGIGRKVGWSTQERFHPLGKPLRLLEEEEAGRVFAALPQEHDGGLLAQTAIGQRDAAMSPLQAANLVVTLLHGGRVQSPRLVSDIRYANGQRMAALPAQGAPSPHGRIAPATAQALLRGMEAVVAQGTGRAIRHGTWTVAGKSGTAQVTVAGRPRNHQWFAGYGPVQSPRYAVAVLAENRSPGSANQATVLFRGVMELIAAHEQGKAASQARL
ncbi:peptidoglycan D,D-transpeptidase FtsI family protein [Paenibacillus abyssi]|uniref:Penicillin-binding protein 4B n=1 Tax=Paenibacillus abyssi TaxID=1340531 RepID=A0A917LFM1_9BACL|nr:penicillin-binding transpeptidase domain-containing protein [Paenibacillus abyssi]GGG19753.1 penicillin-binding protein 4B [Paenibacillus abyssi]